MFKRPISLIIITLLFGFMYADVFMTELADPNNSSSAGRYVELYNNGSSDVDLSSGWALQRWTNGNADPQSAKSLDGTISAGGFYIICNDDAKFLSTYGFDCDQDIGTGGPADSNGDDNMALLDASGTIVDIYGLPGQDGTISSGGTSEFEDGRAERADGSCSGSTTFDATNWNIDHDSGGGDGAQNAPEGFDPGAWIGSAFECGGGVVTCDDTAACNVGEEGSCTYPSGCDEQCGSTAVVDDCGECGGSNACFLAVTFNVNMAAEAVDEGSYGLDLFLDGYHDMTDDDGDGVWSATLQLAGNASYSYKFKNGSAWEVNFNDLGCGDGDTYGNRTFDLGDSDLELPAVCFNSCEDCPQDIPGCMDSEALNYNENATEDDGSCLYPSVPDNLFFSEYAEGSSNHKYLEIYNGSDSDVDLSGYSLSSCSNGCNEHGVWDYPDNITFEAGVVVSAGDVYVVCHGSADDAIQTECDQTFTYLSNGDDVFALTQIGTGTILDVIGTTGDDPGSGWEVAGVSNATKDHTLVRDASVGSGNSGDWASSAGTADGSEWLVFDKDTWVYVGSHPHNFASLCDDATACNNGEEGDCYYADPGFNCNEDPIFNVTFQVDMSDQVVDTEGYGLDLYVDDPYGYHDMTDDDGDGVWSVTLVLVGDTNYSYKFKNGNEWENNFNDLGCGAGDTYGNRTFTLGGADTTLPAACFNSCTECEDECTAGDVNGDSLIDVLDVVAIVDTILDWDLPTLDCSDYDGDGTVNVIDVVQMVELILGGRYVNATESKLIVDGNEISISADGFIGAVQMTLIHGNDFSINLTDDAMIAEYNTTDNSTRLIIVSPGSDELLSVVGDYEIEEIIVANSDSIIECEIDFIIETPAVDSDDVVELAQIKSSKLNAAYPNPFNPIVQMDLDISETANVTINIYNITGQSVGEIVQGVMDYGTHRLSWDAGNLPSGMYYIRANIAGDISTQKIMLLK